MHYIKAKSILSPNGGMNLYRGCSHGCIYCDSRSRIYNMDHDFEDIAVKENAIELLQKTLKGKREKCMIGTGSMTDPYIPLENDLNYIKKSLELIYRYGFGFTCITKSDLVLRDLELIKKINEKTKAVIQMTRWGFVQKARTECCRHIQEIWSSKKTEWQQYSNNRLAMSDSAFHQWYRRQYQWNHWLLHRCECEGNNLLWYGNNLERRKQGVFL